MTSKSFAVTFTKTLDEVMCLLRLVKPKKRQKNFKKTKMQVLTKKIAKICHNKGIPLQIKFFQ